VENRDISCFFSFWSLSLSNSCRKALLVKMPASEAGSSMTGSSDTSLDFELAFQNEEDNVDESTLNIFERCWLSINIPFEAQVITLMTIPIICLVFFSSLIFADTVTRRNYVADHGSLVAQLFDCATALVDERLGGTNVVGSHGASAALAAYKTLSEDSDVLCTRLSDTDSWLRMFTALVYDSKCKITILWGTAFSYCVSLALITAAMTDIIVMAESGLAVLSQSKVLKFESLTLLQLRQFRMVENYLGLSRGVGALWIDQARLNARVPDRKSCTLGCSFVVKRHTYIKKKKIRVGLLQKCVRCTCVGRGP
jgi:hypothetical protein